MEVPNEVIWYGKNESLPEVKTLSAGSLKLTFEDGGLRKIKVGNVEVLRMIYMAVRDYNWGTILPDLRNLDIQEKPGCFSDRPLKTFIKQVTSTLAFRFRSSARITR
jgi:hypothetical protein